MLFLLRLQKEDIREIIFQLTDTFNQEKDFLNDLDSKIGDGDHGLSMSRGFNAISKYIAKNPDISISDILIKGGIQFNEVTGSTIGILMFSAMRAAGKAMQDKSDIDLRDLRKMLAVSIEAIQNRGKSSRGQKTILDSLIPTLEYLESKKNDNKSKVIKDTINIAYQSAQSTKELESQIGRAKWFKERSVGVMDPGAYTGYLMIKTIGEYILERL